MSADPFIRDTIANTYHCLSSGRFDQPKLKGLSQLLIGPLQEVLQEPESTKTVSLRILESRFLAFYFGPEARWDMSLGVQNGLRQLLSQTDIRAAARTRSWEDYKYYKGLKIIDFTQDSQKSNTIRPTLDTLCDQLSREAYECIMTGLDEKVYQFGEVSSRELYNVKCLTRSLGTRQTP